MAVVTYGKLGDSPSGFRAALHAHNAKVRREWWRISHCWDTIRIGSYKRQKYRQNRPRVVVTGTALPSAGSPLLRSR